LSLFKTQRRNFLAQIRIILCFKVFINKKLLVLSGGENDRRLQVVAEAEDERGTQPAIVGHRR
jgi:hypothetical protein